MFRSALIKMTLLYLVIIMAISLFFSLNLYRISAQEIDYNLVRQQQMFERGGRFRQLQDDTSLATLRAEQLAEGQKRIFWQLVYTNIFILFAGGGVSYALAMFTLRPIEEAHEAQARFTADASHELRSPLAAMKSEIEVALRDPKLTKEGATHILRSNLEEVDRLKTLSDSLLELANDKDDYVLGKVSAVEAVQSALGSLAKQVITSGADIQTEVPDDLSLRANKDSIIELLVILLDNAIKYGGDKPKIVVKAGKTAIHAVISVTDSGPGISEEALPHVFERFYRAETSRTKNNASGYGLGLSIAEKIVHKNGGRIEVASNRESGTTFQVFLSLA